MIQKISRKLVEKYRHTTIPSRYVLIFDVVMLIVLFFLTEAFSASSFVAISKRGLLMKFIIMLATTLIAFLLSRSYRVIMRHVGANDILRILYACGGTALVLTVYNALNNNYFVLPQRYLLSYHEIFMLYSALSAAMILTRLFGQRVYNDRFKHRRPTRSLVIYGAGAAGVIAYDALKQDQKFEYHVVAFIDDDPSKIGQAIDGVPIHKAAYVLNTRFVREKSVHTVIIAIPNITLDLKKDITDQALDLGLEVKAVPHISTWINGSFSANQIQNIKIEDLLERDSIRLDNINIIREVLDKVVLVTGAAGSIGSEICRQLIQYKPKRIIMLDQAESPMYDLQFELRNTEPYCQSVDIMEFVITNVKDHARMEEVFSKFRPQIVYHAAAYKHVPFMEENPYEAVYVNVFGTKNVADLAIQYGAQKFVMISTDKAVNPTNVMGATKRMAEIYIQSRSTDQTHFVTTRFGNVLGSNGSVIPLFKKQLEAGGPLTVTHRDIIRYFMTIPEACNLVLEAGAMGQGGDIFVFDMGKPVRIYDLATKMIQLSGLHNIEIKEIGLRPGEKLYEELLATKENNIPTYHPKILRAQVRKYELAEIDKEYAHLWDILTTLNDMDIVAEMKAIVPEFVSNNSIYCSLDRKAEEK